MRKISTLLLTAAALIGCEQHEHTHSSTSPDAQDPGSIMVPADRVLSEFKISKGTTVRFTEAEGQITWALQGPISEREANRDLEEKLGAAKSMESAYRLLDKEGEVPMAILEYDKRSADPAETTSPELPSESGPGSVVPEAHSHSPLAKTADHAVPSADSWWNWTNDANWWKGDVVGYKCGWHEAAHYTNVTWADDWRQGWFGKGYLMAASHTYAARAWAYLWVNGAWSQTNYLYLQPRHYVVWSSGDTSKRYRRYRVEGYGGAYARIHWGMRWDSQAPSDLGVICQE